MLLATASSTPAALRVIDDFWTELGLAESDVQDSIFHGLSTAEFSGTLVRSLRAMPDQARLALIGRMAVYAQSYSRSDDFKRRYAAWREQHKPADAAIVVASAQGRRQEDRAAALKNIKEIEDGMKGMTAEQRAPMLDVLKSVREQLKEIDNPANPLYGSTIEAGLTAQNRAEEARHSAALRTWEATYPADHQVTIRASLLSFIALSKTVDYGAKLKRSSFDQMEFVRADYEAKSKSWKSMYRAGGGTTGALRAAAQQWLGEMR